MILQALFYLLKSSKIKHFEVHKMAIEKWVGLMERCSGVVNKPLLSRLLGQIHVFIHRFYRQVQLGQQPLSWLCHERIVSCLIRYMRDNPAEPENEDVFPILEWVIEQEVVTKSVLLQKHHLATALAMVMESENVEAHNKELAWKIQKSLNDWSDESVDNHKGKSQRKKTLLGKKIEILIQIFNCDLGRLCRCIIIVRKDHDSTMALWQGIYSYPSRGEHIRHALPFFLALCMPHKNHFDLDSARRGISGNGSIVTTGYIAQNNQSFKKRF